MADEGDGEVGVIVDVGVIVEVLVAVVWRLEVAVRVCVDVGGIAL